VQRLVQQLLARIGAGRIRIIADAIFPLPEVKSAYEAIAARRTIGKVVLVP
jgi:NADPH:quinone reductase-like Zn-dependent oxidoreductase